MMEIQRVFFMFLARSICEMTAMKTKVITTKTGNVQGVVEKSVLSGKKVQKFTNIPYAEPPVGKLRFSKPKPRRPWKGTLDSTKKIIACWQQSKPGRSFTEDCLILNIWTPYPQPTNASVMVWIHGGNFTFGRSSSYPGYSLVAIGQIILVTINYRLSVLGFLSSGDGRIKGNFGLFDQRLAMKWVKENIASFGGNPQSITIFGLSAGAASVSAHTVSPQSWPYFNRAIQQSGAITMPWATVSKHQAKKALHLFLTLINCTDNENLLACLQRDISSGDWEKIFTSTPFAFNKVLFAPCVDEEFLIDEPKKLFDKGMVKNDDVILGVSKDEGFLIYGPLLQVSRNTSFFTMKFKELLKEYFKDSSEAVYNKALKLYQPKCISSFMDTFKPIVAFSSDDSFICDTKNEAKLRLQFLHSKNVYFYEFSYSSPVPIRMYPHGTFGLAAHATDVIPTFGFSINNRKYPYEDQILSMRMILYWTNFAKNGDPNLGTTKLPIVLDNINSLPMWPKYTNFNRQYLDMESLSRMTVRKRLREVYCKFLEAPEELINQVTSATKKNLIQEVLLSG